MLNDNSIKLTVFKILDKLTQFIVFIFFIEACLINFIRILVDSFTNFDKIITIVIALIGLIFYVLSLTHDETKYVFRNFKYKFSLFQSIDNNIEDGYNVLLGAAFFTLLLTSWHFFLDNNNFQSDIHFFMMNLLFCFIVIIMFLKKREFYQTFPFSHLLSRNLNLFTLYLDYKNNIIEDDKPFIEINQFFEVKAREYPRNSVEENEVLILNPKTPKKPALVTIIEDKNLADMVREGKYELKAQLISIQELTILEIDLWLEQIQIK